MALYHNRAARGETVVIGDGHGNPIAVSAKKLLRITRKPDAALTKRQREQYLSLIFNNAILSKKYLLLYKKQKGFQSIVVKPLHIGKDDLQHLFLAYNEYDEKDKTTRLCYFKEIDMNMVKVLPSGFQ